MNATMTPEVVLPEGILPLDLTKYRPSINVPNPIRVFDPARVQAYVAHQQLRHQVTGHGIRMSVANMRNLNIEVLQWFLQNPYQFQLELCNHSAGMPFFLFFWNTILKDENGIEYVACLWWERNALHAGVRSLDSLWDTNSAAAQYAA